MNAPITSIIGPTYVRRPCHDVEPVIADGIYFALPEGIYRADPALGSTDMKRLFNDVAVYWHGSVLNPNREPEEDTPAKLFGRAVHKIVLEGAPAFDAAYGAKAEGPDYLHSSDDISAWIKGVSEERSIAKPKIGTSKSDRIANMITLARECGVTHPPLADAVDAANIAAGRVLLSEQVHERVLGIHGGITANPHLANAFDGPTEVSVFWTRDRVRRKARLDCLKVRSTTDLKTISPKREEPFKKACCRAIDAYRYDMQAAHYIEARRQIPGFVASGAVWGDHDPAWLARVQGDGAFVFIFLRVDGPPQTCPLTLSPGSDILNKARLDLDAAAAAYRDATEAFGAGKPWITAEAPAELDIADLPVWFGR